MKNCVEFFVAELLPPIERGQILRDEIAAIAGQVLEIAGTKIIDHGQPRLRHPLLQGEDKVGADETGAARNENGRIRGRHAKRRGDARLR